MLHFVPSCSSAVTLLVPFYLAQDNNTDTAINIPLSMASFWGEILPVSSRAVNDDEDDDDYESDSSRPPMRDCDMIWNPEVKEETVTCRLLIIADGEAASQFLDAALLWRKESTLVGVLNSGFVQVSWSVIVLK